MRNIIQLMAEEVNTIALSANDDKRIKPIDSSETYAHVTSNEQRSSM